MLFHTPEFFFLLAITIISYYLFRNLRLVLLAVADGLFYAAASWGFFLLFFTITFVSYFVARRIQGPRGRMWLILGIVINVANLLFFKYSIFILHNVEALTGLTLVTTNSFWQSIVLPIGISFYTFQLIAYLVDTYKGKIQPTDSFLRFWVFISFFPHQLAGPIMRGNEFMPQVEMTKNLKISPGEFKFGVYLIMWGLAKKILIADQLAPYVDTYFQSPENLTMVEAWIGAYLFAFQIYADFSGYSDMAVGLGYLFGYRLPINFRTPYLSANATEFWRRWHITLSSWIRDYIYIPLGGSRKGRIRKDLNLLGAMLISGLWHGAMWTFVIWGFLHGMLSVLHKWYVDFFKKIGQAHPFLLRSFSKVSGLYHVIAVLVFFHLVTLIWVFFRAGNVQNALSYLSIMLKPIHWDALVQQVIQNKLFLGISLLLFVAHVLEYFFRKYEGKISELWHRWIPAPIRALIYAVIIYIIIFMIKGEKHDFIYFQF